MQSIAKVMHITTLSKHKKLRCNKWFNNKMRERKVNYPGKVKLSLIQGLRLCFNGATVVSHVEHRSPNLLSTQNRQQLPPITTKNGNKSLPSCIDESYIQLKCQSYFIRLTDSLDFDCRNLRLQSKENSPSHSHPVPLSCTNFIVTLTLNS